MNLNKIDFLCCTNNRLLLEESAKSLQRLNTPNGFYTNLLTAENVQDITKAYNILMKESDAKYKIYLHQDVGILNKNFIYDIFKIFEDETIGMIGMCGCKKLPGNYTWWEGECYGKVTEHRGSLNNLIFEQPNGDYEEVESIDGLMMITQYDIDWNEQIKGFDFYDVSQCKEFQKKGLKIVVPKQENPWAMHVVNPRFNAEKYNSARLACKEIYK